MPEANQICSARGVPAHGAYALKWLSGLWFLLIALCTLSNTVWGQTIPTSGRADAHDLSLAAHAAVSCRYQAHALLQSMDVEHGNPSAGEARSSPAKQRRPLPAFLPRTGPGQQCPDYLHIAAGSREPAPRLWGGGAHSLAVILDPASRLHRGQAPPTA